MSPRLLVVDDYELSRQALSKRLRKCGFEVETADGGRAAVDLVHRNPYDLVLLDVMMPDLDGFSVLQEVRERFTARELPIIVVTARDASSDVVKAFRLGANDHVSKPIDFDVTLARIQALLACAPPAETEPGVLLEEAPALPEDEEVPVGTVLGGYTIRGVLGRGGMGIVYEAENPQLDAHAAVKLLRPCPFQDPAAEQRFRNEARAAARIEHPNVVGVYDVGKWGSRIFIAMQLVRGRSAQDLVDERGALPWREATRIVAEACRGLVAAHARGVVHCDLKPENILICDDGNVKITDYGLARMLEAPTAETAALMGTPSYMSPEQIRSQPVDARTDLYALGGTYYTLLSGLRPYGHLTQWIDMVAAHCSEPPPEVTDGQVPAACGEIVRRAMAKRPEERFASAADMLAALPAG